MVWCCASSAATVSYRGNLSQDADVRLLPFSLDEAAEVSIRTFSYAGGIQGDGTAISAGGFDPILEIFDGTGAHVGHSDDDTTGTVRIDPQTHEALDALFRDVLPAGLYTVALAQFDNVAAGDSLLDGFTREGQGDFTGLLFGCSNLRFCDFKKANRSEAWALDISVNPVPEPSVYALVVMGLVAAWVVRGRGRYLKCKATSTNLIPLIHSTSSAGIWRSL
jgi:hypothetical protein